MNHTPLQKLPIGIQDFIDLRQNNYLYVDKTKYLVDLIDSGKVYSLSTVNAVLENPSPYKIQR